MRRPWTYLLGALAILVASSIVGGIGGSTSHPTTSQPFSIIHPAPGVASTSGLVVPTALPATGAQLLSHPAAAPKPLALACPTPSNTPNWNSPAFFSDVKVTFQVPGNPALSGSNFGVLPCVNHIPTYTTGFWVNVTTNVKIELAQLTIWGIQWPTAANPSPPLPGYDPSYTPTQLTHVMRNIQPANTSAAYFMNVYRDFWPGCTVGFNMTVLSSDPNATPSIIRSAQGTFSHPQNSSSGTVNNATWGFMVDSPWPSTDFTQDIDVATSPPVLSPVQFEPNPYQALQFRITSILAGLPSTTPIPKAFANITVTGPRIGVASGRLSFGPDNHTVMQLTTPLGPYPDSQAQVQITAYLPWRGGIVDQIVSPIYAFNWSAHGGWAFPNSGLSSNLQLTISPNVDLTGKTNLPTATPVNVSIHSQVANITIKSAVVHFRYADAAGWSSGVVPMTPTNANTSYALLRGLPPNGRMTFSVEAKDIFGTVVASGNYTYTESGPMASALPPGYGLFFFEAVDISTGQLVPSLNYTLANATWSETRAALPFGFGAPVPLVGTEYLPVSFDKYTLTVRAFGFTPSATFSVSGNTPFVVVFYVASAGSPATASTPPLTLPALLPAILGVGGAAVAVIPIRDWFKERQRKAEAEQRRITL